MRYGSKRGYTQIQSGIWLVYIYHPPIMLLRYGRLHIPLPRPSSLKNYSTENNYSNFTKLRAFPFVMSPEMAQRDMSRAVSPLCNNGKIWAAIMSTLFDKNLLHPIRFSAAYFPAWVVNAEIEADITYGDTRRRGSVILRNSYIPGSHMPTLSAAPLWGPELDGDLHLLTRSTRTGDEPLPFEESMLKQHGQEIQCIPFTTSPFAVLDVARNLSWSNAIINENLKFSPSSLKVNMFSAYPVLLPLYIAMYDIKRDGGSSGTLTAWIQAHLKWPNVMIENCLHQLDRDWAYSLSRILGYVSDFSTDSEIASYVPPAPQVTVDMVSFPATKKASEAIAEWLQRSLKSSSNISHLASKIENDNDPRIRPMTADEKLGLDKYFRIESEILLARRVMVDLENARPDATVFTIGLGKTSPVGTTPKAASIILQAKLDELNTIKGEVTPGWWSEWELSKNHSP